MSKIQRSIIKFVPWLVLLLVLSILMRLGFWQLFRADEKQQLLDARAIHETAEAATLEQLLTTDEVQFRPLLLQGQWQQHWSFYQDNRIKNALPGYNIFSLFLDDSGNAIFVDRGWLAINKLRQFNFVAPRQNQTRVMGYAYQPSLYEVIELATPKQQEVIPLLGLHIEQLVRFFKQKNINLAPFILRQTFPETEAGLLRQWDVVAMPPERHFGYAVQWFSLALTLACMVIIIIWKKRKEK